MVAMNSNQPQMLNLIDSIIGLNKKTPKDYSHDWHVEFLDKLSDIYGSPLFAMLAPTMTTQIQDKISSAQQVDSKPSITLPELEGIIKGCNMLLDIASNEKELSQSFNSIQGGLTVDMDSLGKSISLITSMDEDTAKRYILQKIKISVNVIVLAILDVLLSPHFDARYYPGTKVKVVIDGNFPLVIKYADLCSILKRSIDMDRAYIT